MTNEVIIQALRDLHEHVELRMCTTIEKRLKYRSALRMAIEALEKIEELNSISNSARPNGKMLWVSPGVYERIKNNPDAIVIESQCKPPIILKTVGVKK